MINSIIYENVTNDSHVSICEAWGDMGPVSPVHRDAPSVGAVTLASSSSCTIWRLGLVDNTKQNQLARSKTRVAVVDYSLARAHRSIPATIHRLQHNQGSRVTRGCKVRVRKIHNPLENNQKRFSRGSILRLYPYFFNAPFDVNLFWKVGYHILD